MPFQNDETRFQVFVSSTFTDLKPERDKVLQAILEIRAFPAGMELFPAADDEQFEFIKREIESSDYYVVIIAGRYGSIAADGISFTEKEYDFAASIGKPILTFIYRDLGKLIGDRLEQTDQGKAKLEQFRTKAQKGRLVSFFENPDDLKAKALNSLNQSFNFKPMRGWMRAGLTSRVDLEKINQLQERVLELESENRRLRALRDDTADLLASGESRLEFTLDLTGFKINGVEPATTDLRIDPTWDEMLFVIFPGGTSFVTSKQIETGLALWIFRRLDPETEEAIHMKHLGIMQIGRGVGDLRAIRQLKIVLHRQFTGLGFIIESQELAYRRNSLAKESIPYNQTVWRLTEKGERYLALKRGFLLGPE